MGTGWGAESQLDEVKHEPMGSRSHGPQRRLKAEYIFTVLLESEPRIKEEAERAPLTWRGDLEVRVVGTLPAFFSGQNPFGALPRH